MKSRLYCGAARAEITPDASWYPLYAGFFTGEVRDNFLVGALDAQYARAIAVKNDDTTVLLVSLDLGSVPCGQRLIRRISEATSVAEENIFIVATHTHNVPAMGNWRPLKEDENFLKFQEARPDVAKHHLMYEERIWENTVRAAEEAVASMRPAKMGIGYTNSYVNVNRDQLYNGVWGMGYNGEGHSDKTLALIRFADENDKTIAVFANYAVHAIVLFLNHCIDGKGGSTGDLPGVVCNAYETQNPGTVCIWSPAANGNQNPIVMVYYGYPDFETGNVFESVAEGGYEFLTMLAGRHYADLLRAQESISDYTDCADLRAERKFVLVPARADIPPRYPDPDAAPDQQKICLSGVQMGNIILYGIGGELYSDVGAHLKEISPYRHTLICSQCTGTAGYMMGDKDLLAPTLFAARTRWLPGTLVPAFEDFLRNFTK